MEGERFPKKRIEFEEVPVAGPTSSSLNNPCDQNINSSSGNIDPMTCSESEKRFTIDHSIRGTAKCKECSKVIPKNELRIGKLIPYKEKFITCYYHVKCAFASFRRARVASNVISDVRQLDGVERLNTDERKVLDAFIRDENESRVQPLKLKYIRKEKPGTQTTAKERKSRLAASPLPSINIMYTNADQLTPGKKTELMLCLEREKPLGYSSLRSQAQELQRSPIT